MAGNCASMNTDVSNWLTCCICGAPSDGMHFGAIACRACAAFFRRSVNLRKRYVCWNGRGNCTIFKSIRNICQGCRYQKCLRCGMLPEYVQPKRDFVRKNCNQMNFEDYLQMRTSNLATPSMLTLPSNNFQNENESEGALKRLSINLLSQTSGGLSCSVNNSTGPGLLLDIIEQSCVLMAEKKKYIEQAILVKYGYSSLLTSNEIVMGSYERCIEMCRASIPLIYDFIKTFFKEFDEFASSKKHIIFFNFSKFVWTMDCLYFTIHKIPPGKNRFLMLTTFIYVDLDKLEDFFTSDVNPAVVDIFRDLFEWQETVIKLVRNFQLTNKEFGSILVLTLLSEGINHATSSEMRRSIRERQKKVFDDLHYYFVEKLHVNNYAHRLGEAMTILKLMQQIQHKLNAKADVAEALGLFNIREILFGNFNFTAL